MTEARAPVCLLLDTARSFYYVEFFPFTSPLVNTYEYHYLLLIVNSNQIAFQLICFNLCDLRLLLSP